MKTIGIDTNILLRLIVNDDAAQRLAVLKFGAGLNRDYFGLVTLLSLVEADWALRTQYGYERKQSVAALQKITSIRGVTIESADAVALAIRLVDLRGVDFADALIAFRSTELGCEAIMTLDQKAAARVPGMELLAGDALP